MHHDRHLAVVDLKRAILYVGIWKHFLSKKAISRPSVDRIYCRRRCRVLLSAQFSHRCFGCVGIVRYIFLLRKELTDFIFRQRPIPFFPKDNFIQQTGPFLCRWCRTSKKNGASSKLIATGGRRFKSLHYNSHDIYQFLLQMLLVETLADAHALCTFASWFLVLFKNTSISCPAGLSFCSSMSFRWHFLDSSSAQKTKCIHNSQQKVLWSACWVESPNTTYTNEAFPSSLTAFASAPLLLMTFPKKRVFGSKFLMIF